MSLQGRIGVLKVHARGKKVDPALDYEKVARATAGFTGAEIMNLMNQSGGWAGKRGKGWEQPGWLAGWLVSCGTLAGGWRYQKGSVHVGRSCDRGPSALWELPGIYLVMCLML